MIRFNSKIISNRGKITVCTSGGIDSVACLHFLHNSNRSIEAFHFNHKMISADDAIEDRVRDMCSKLGIAITVASADVFKLPPKMGKESAARSARYAALDTMISDNVIVCHHLDDAVESYLMNCFNGNDDHCPIPPITLRSSCTIFRPFLLTKKTDLQEYINDKKLNQYIYDDPLNYDSSVRRNFIRKQVLPLIKTRYVGLDKVVAKKVKAIYDIVVSDAAVGQRFECAETLIEE